jgi:thiol-disulfide isomerase/thioredoxin
MALLAQIACVAAPAAADPAAVAKHDATLYLQNSDFVAGRLVDSPAGALVWQSPAFKKPFKFGVDAINAIHFPDPDAMPKLDSEYRFELVTGDVLLGSLQSCEDGCFVVDAPQLGQLHVEQASVKRIIRTQAAELIYWGPRGLDGWRTSGPGGAWRNEGGHILTSQKGAELYRDFNLPAQVCVEFELSWVGEVDFEWMIGVGPDAKTAAHAFRFEFQGKTLVVLRETALEADIAKALEIEPSVDRLHLFAFLDQTRGKLVVYSADGKALAQLELPDKDPAQPGIQLVNKKGDLRLERLCVSRWSGELPLAVESGKPRAQTADGVVVYGDVTGYDAAARQFIIHTPTGDERMEAARVRELVLPTSPVAPKRSIAAVLHSGGRVSGELIKIEQDVVWLDAPEIRGTVAVKVADLHALEANNVNKTEPVVPGRKGRLELAGTMLHGCLVDGRESDEGCLVWRSAFSDSACPLAPETPGRIVYRDPPPPRTAGPEKKGEPGLLAQIFGQMAPVDAKGSPKVKRGGTPLLHLRTGDEVSIKVAKIDEQGVTFASDSTSATFVPHEQVQALELAPETPAVKILKQKKDRLLTLPRMQRDNPPTQLIRSLNGDYLRGRLQSMDDKELQVELRLSAKSVPVASVARIVWLHPEASGAAAEVLPPAEHPSGRRVQALSTIKGQKSSTHLTFFAEELADSQLSGKSDVLGQCQVDLKSIDQLLIGKAIEQAVSGLAFHQWTLKAAAEPRPDDEGSGESEGKESALVGKPAPDVELDLLGGGKFRVADFKQQVLVLDFWASWCGPCLQTMPLIDKVAKEFADQNVRLVGVNLEEGPDRIGLTLEKLQIEMNVALDREGRMAEKYGATSIPQTVIIDRDGKVARVFVGGNSKFDEQLRDALRSVLSPPEPAKKE